MGYYIALPFIAALPGIFLCNEKMGRKGRIIYCAFFGLLVFLTEALRSYVGTDYASYSELYYFMNFADMDEVMSLAHEKGFVVPLKMLNEIFYERYAMFGCIAFIVAVGMAVFMYRHSDKPWVSAAAIVCFGPVFYSMNFMRQFIAGIIIMFAFEYIKSRSFFKYLVLVLLASCFHWAALVMIPFYFILRIDINIPVLIAYTAFSVVLFCGSDVIIDIGLNTFYTKYQADYMPDLKLGVALVYPVGYTLMFIAAFAFRKKLCEINPDNSMYISCLFFIAMFELLGAKHAMLSRFGLFFVIPPMICLMPDLVTAMADTAGKKLDAKKSAIVSVSVFSLCALLFYSQLIMINSNGVVPYRTVFEDTGYEDEFVELDDFDMLEDDVLDEDDSLEDSDINDDEILEEEGVPEAEEVTEAAEEVIPEETAVTEETVISEETSASEETDAFEEQLVDEAEVSVQTEAEEPEKIVEETEAEVPAVTEAPVTEEKPASSITRDESGAIDLSNLFNDDELADLLS